MNKWFRIGSALAAAGIVVGAFGAHGLKASLTADQLAVYETGVRYHLINTLGVFGLGLIPSRPRYDLAANLLCIGILLFCGSLYALAITGVKALGIITPFGGLAFIVGWIVLAASPLQESPTE